MGNEKVYEVVTDRIIKLIEAGTVPWRKPWRGGRGGAPRNAVSKRPYRGGNAMWLGCFGYEDARFVTFKQAGDLGGHVRKGEKGFPIVFFQAGEDKEGRALTTAGRNAKPRRWAILRYSTVFNVSQCEGLELDVSHAPEAAPDPIAAADAILRAYLPGPVYRNGTLACYRPTTDEVVTPAMGRFESAAHYYATLFHEVGHSTGHESRLKRDGITNSFGSHEYSKEELVAEMTACFLLSEAGIGEEVFDNSAAYLAGWMRVLRTSDKRFILEAASAAQKAVDLVLARRPATEEEAA